MTKWDIYGVDGKIGVLEAVTYELARDAARKQYPELGNRVRVYRAKVEQEKTSTRAERLARRIPRR
jgi:hypothetical protein